MRKGEKTPPVAVDGGANVFIIPRSFNLKGQLTQMPASLLILSQTFFAPYNNVINIESSADDFSIMKNAKCNSTERVDYIHSSEQLNSFNVSREMHF